MAKDKYVPRADGATGVAVAEDPDKDVEATPTVEEPTVAPAPEEAPAPAVAEPAPAAAQIDNAVTLSSIPMLQWQSSEAKGVLELLEAAEKMSKALRSRINFFLGAENARRRISQG